MTRDSLVVHHAPEAERSHLIIQTAGILKRARPRTVGRGRVVENLFLVAVTVRFRLLYGFVVMDVGTRPGQSWVGSAPPVHHQNASDCRMYRRVADPTNRFAQSSKALALTTPVPFVSLSGTGFHPAVSSPGGRVVPR
jgi:hypothetical protein